MTQRATRADRSPLDLTDRDDLARLAQRPAWERASVYAALDLDFGERQTVELAVRSLIRSRYEPEYRRRRRT